MWYIWYMYITSFSLDNHAYIGRVLKIKMFKVNDYYIYTNIYIIINHDKLVVIYVEGKRNSYTYDLDEGILKCVLENYLRMWPKP